MMNSVTTARCLELVSADGAIGIRNLAPRAVLAGGPPVGEEYADAPYPVGADIAIGGVCYLYRKAGSSSL